MDEERQLRVVGDASIEAIPDSFVLHVAVNAMAESAAEALHQVTGMVTSAIRTLKDRQIPETSLRTQNLRLQDWFDQTTQQVTARVASYELEVTLDDVDQVGEILTALTADVGDTLQLRGIRPTIVDTDPLYREALGRAVAHARAKAETLAEAAGITLGPIVSIEEHDAGASFRPSSMRAKMSSGSAASAVPIEPGTMSVRAAVIVMYGIG